METESQTSRTEEVVESSEVVSDQVETPEVSAEGGDSKDLELDGAVEGEAPAYEPNFKYKVLGEEKEFDEWAKKLVKSKEDEDFYRDILTKVHGVDHIKQERDSFREQANTLRETQERYQTLTQNLDVLSQYVNNGNLDAFFQSIGITQDQVMQYAMKQLQLSEMTPEQRAEYERATRAQQNEVLLGQQNEQLSTQMQELQHRQRMFELDSFISQPGLNEQVSAFDQRLGQAGAFKQEVINRAVAHYNQTGQDLPVKDAVESVLRVAGISVGQQTTQMAPSPQGTPHAAQTKVVPQEKPTIPNTKGSGLSPTKRKISSIEDLKKLAAARA